MATSRPRLPSTARRAYASAGRGVCSVGGVLYHGSMRQHGLSKSRIMAGLQCRKRLWLQVHRPELVSYGPAQQRIFRQGDEVGAIARSLFPGGVLVGGADGQGAPAPGSLRAAELETRRHLAGRDDTTLFEATFSHDGVLVRADILQRRAGACRMTEVKSSTKVKDAQILDAAVQAWVLRSCGVPLEYVGLMVLDRDFVYQGDGRYDGLLTETDVTAAVAGHLRTLPHKIAELRDMLAGPPPKVPIGPACKDPYECPLLSHCCADADYHVACLPRGLALAAELQAEGFRDVREVPEDRLVDPEHLRIRQATLAGRPLIDPRLPDLLRGLPYPRFYLDFETISLAVPLWAGRRPWQSVPFQFSLHIEYADGRLEHREFLDLSGRDPGRACADALLRALQGSDGPVLAYTSFEFEQLRGLASACPDLRSPLQAVMARLVDLYPPVRQYYYHPDMRGSWSIKSVLPTVAPDLTYDDLAGVHEGGEAEAAYSEAIDTHTPHERREQLREQLLRYCERDTLAMVRLVRHFQSLPA